jgi:hypothetical protein
VIGKFAQRITVLHYPQVFAIVDHLCEARSLTSRPVEQLLFDLRWSKTDYPFGFSGKKGFSEAKPILPVKGDMFPAVIASTVLSHEMRFTPFSVLNSLPWLFKSSVDMLFEMLILTNPFEIARGYWNVIQEVTSCMHNDLLSKGKHPDDIEIDFDSLFPVLMICVFAFGIDEWIQVALYCVSFNDQVGEDPQLQFVMSYLEAVVTQILALDQDNLKRKAVAMRKAWADEQSDPLGVH